MLGLNNCCCLPAALPRPAGHEAGEEHVEVYRESLTPEGNLIYTLPREAGLMPAPTGLHGTSLLAPYQRLEVSACLSSFWWSAASSRPFDGM